MAFSPTSPGTTRPSSAGGRKIEDNVDWAAVRAVEDFYLNIPPMADLQLLWTRIERHQPIVLTGVPEEIAAARL